jgi:hypothetical protein
MKILLCLLTFFTTLGCVGGCIPIGVRGSTIASAQSPSCVTASQIDAQLRPAAGAPTTGDHPVRAQPHCA